MKLSERPTHPQPLRRKNQQIGQPRSCNPGALPGPPRRLWGQGAPGNRNGAVVTTTSDADVGRVSASPASQQSVVSVAQIWGRKGWNAVWVGGQGSRRGSAGRCGGYWRGGATVGGRGRSAATGAAGTAAAAISSIDCRGCRRGPAPRERDENWRMSNATDGGSIVSQVNQMVTKQREKASISRQL